MIAEKAKDYPEKNYITDDRERFFEACRKVTAEGERKGIGTLSEKALHRILKLYCEPREELHEIPFMGAVADIKNEKGIIEIQTASFTPLIPKLKKLLPSIPVTVVHPIIKEKRLIWLDKETGELSEPKKSPKKGKFSDALPELFKVCDFLGEENFSVSLLLLSADEYKYLDGYGKDRKKRATKIERLPRDLIEGITISSPEDIRKIIPPLPSPFKSCDFNKATGLMRRKAFFALKLLEKLKIAEKVGKEGNSYLYKLTVENEN